MQLTGLWIGNIRVYRCSLSNSILRTRTTSSSCCLIDCLIDGKSHSLWYSGKTSPPIQNSCWPWLVDNNYSLFYISPYFDSTDTMSMTALTNLTFHLTESNYRHQPCILFPHLTLPKKQQIFWRKSTKTQKSMKFTFVWNTTLRVLKVCGILSRSDGAIVFWQLLRFS